jgi:hypothetical protein
MDMTRIILLCLILLLGGCKDKKQPKTINRAIYFWKTTFDLSQKEKDFLEENKIEKAYLRFFDVDMIHNEAVPKGVVSLKSQFSQEIVPTVFITNRVFEKLKIGEIETLSERVLSQINSISKQYKEIQFDCDWSIGTKDKYFFFLEKLKEKAPKGILFSATIRLHQIKFSEKTGIPPVDEGVLMLYNTGDWRKLSGVNSLFDAQTSMAYFDNLSQYPLHLNLALPIFSQVLAYRNGIFYTFIKNCSLNNLESNLAIKKTSTEGQFVCLKDHTFQNISFRKGDILKYENVNKEALEKTKNKILDRIKDLKTTIILYHLDEKNISEFSDSEVSQLFTQN